MKKILLYCLLWFLFPNFCVGQVEDGAPFDSVTVRFSDTMSAYVSDTGTVPLWQIGTTTKTFFETGRVRTFAIMTDTLHPYPANANNWFVLKIRSGFNTIVDFWHKYQTDSGHAGGAVEFSVDDGNTWQNVLGPCHEDHLACTLGITTTDFYSATDTLNNGTPAFMGTTDSVVFSRLQFGSGCLEASTSSCELHTSVYYVRFRFMSDSTTDTLAGWRIDSVKVEYDNFGGGAVAKVGSNHPLQIFPNPTSDFTFQFPALEDQNTYSVAVFDALGVKIIDVPYSQRLSLSDRQRGVYFYMVTNGVNYYSGQLVVE